MKNNNLLNENKLQNSNAYPEKAIRSDDKKAIAMAWALPARDYALFNAKTGVQETPFVNGEKGYVEFKNLNPNKKYEVRGGVVSKGDKPKIVSIWTLPLYNDEHKNT